MLLFNRLINIYILCIRNGQHKSYIIFQVFIPVSLHSYGKNLNEKFFKFFDKLLFSDEGLLASLDIFVCTLLFQKKSDKTSLYRNGVFITKSCQKETPVHRNVKIRRLLRITCLQLFVSLEFRCVPNGRIFKF